MNETGEMEPSNPYHGLVPRPTEAIQLLSPEHRWEFTRRHPYYLMLWDVAAGTASLVRDTAGAEATLLRQRAELVLTLVNLVGTPVHPGTSFDELDENELPEEWRGGAISPVTCRNLVAGFAGLAPPETQQAASRLLSNHAKGDREGRFSAMREMTRGDWPGADLGLPNAIYINPQAPLRAILNSITKYVGKLKEEHNIPERRRRDEKIPDYLAVWDAREGWIGDGYDPSREQRLRTVAKSFECSINTIANRYAKAFEYLVGQPYSSEAWVQVIGLAKSSGYFGAKMPSRTMRRFWRSRSAQADVPDSTLSLAPDDETPTLLEQAGASADQLGTHELLMDIEELLGRGRTDDAILKELELERTPGARDLIAYLREHRDDLSVVQAANG